MACGGQNTRDTCLQLVDGVWIKSHNLKTKRDAHTSWTTTDGTLLIGGRDGLTFTTLVKVDGTTEVGTIKYPSV